MHARIFGSPRNQIRRRSIGRERKGMKMVVRLKDSCDVRITPPVLLFKIEKNLNLIRGVSLQGVLNRLELGGWMDAKVPLWPLEPTVFSSLPHGRKQVLYFNNCFGHKTTPKRLEAA